MKRKYLWLAAAIVSILLLASVRYYISLFAPPGDGRIPIIVEFQPGTDFHQIANALKQGGIIKNRFDFTLLAILRGSTKKIRAGEYEFDTSMSAFKVLERLEKGEVRKHYVTIPEGYNIRDIAELLSREGLSEKGHFIAKSFDGELLSSFGIDSASAEGYLFPDTYQFIKGMSAEDIIKTMVSRFRAVFADEMATRAKDTGRSVNEVITLASIVEKETGVSYERPVIAGLLLNRLRKGIPLQSDPTVIYGVKEFNGNLARKDLRTKTPYNTYLKKGLPPTPIANPGLDSIKAVLYPATTPYLYFVSKNDGTHHFSKTLSEHNRAVQRYQMADRGAKNQNLPQRRGNAETSP